jgi:hypothetical protein
VTLENLLKIGKLKAHEPNHAELVNLFSAAGRNLKDVHVAGLSAETRFDVAYKAIMQCGLLALMANGLRPSTAEPGHHATVIQTLPRTIGLSNERMIVLDSLRKKRNLADYVGQGISESEAATCLHVAEALIETLKQWLRAHRPEVLERSAH